MSYSKPWNHLTCNTKNPQITYLFTVGHQVQRQKQLKMKSLSAEVLQRRERRHGSLGKRNRWAFYRRCCLWGDLRKFLSSGFRSADSYNVPEAPAPNAKSTKEPARKSAQRKNPVQTMHLSCAYNNCTIAFGSTAIWDPELLINWLETRMLRGVSGRRCVNYS